MYGGAVVRGLAAGVAVGLVGRWSGPTVAILAAVSGVVFFDLLRRARNERDGGADRPHDRFGLAVEWVFFAMLCAAAWDNRSRYDWPSPGWFEALGLAVVGGGALLRQRAAQALGRQFTVRLSVLDDHQLVASGPYRWVRHPNYAGLGLIALGTAMMVGSATAAAVGILLWLPAVLLHIRDEERTLHIRLGAAYAEYARRSWRLVPGVY